MSAHRTSTLGAFSVSLSVADLAASRAFYEKLGFAAAGGDEEQNWLTMRNGDAVIGLFHGMFDGNVLTFNPGWDQGAEPLPEFTDIRELRLQIAEHGIDAPAVESASGPGHTMFVDPDGNAILIDQHR